jgi:hypothetical protein
MSAILDWLFEHAPDESVPPPQVSPRISPPPRIPDHSDVDQNSLPSGTDWVDLDQVFVVIEYGDEGEWLDRRRITMIKLLRGPHAPILRAVCHERRALRSFRTDRIRCVIDADGEIFNTQDYFRNVFMIDLDQFGPDQEAEALKAARAIRDYLRPGLSILVCAATSDEEFHDKELDVIEAWARTEVAAFPERRPEQFTEDELTLRQLRPLIAAMRPQRKSLPGYLYQILQQQPERTSRIEGALTAVFEADGRITRGEVEFAESLTVQITKATSRLEQELAEYAGTW